MLRETLNKLNKLLFSIMLSSTFIFPWVLLWANVYDGFWECNTMAIEKQTESGNKTKVTCIRTATLKRYFTQKWKYCHHFLIIPILTILLHNTKHDILKNVSNSHWSPTRGGWYGKNIISWFVCFFPGKKISCWFYCFASCLNSTAKLIFLFYKQSLARLQNRK